MHLSFFTLRFNSQNCGWLLMRLQLAQQLMVSPLPKICHAASQFALYFRLPFSNSTFYFKVCSVFVFSTYFAQTLYKSPYERKVVYRHNWILIL